MSGYIVDTNIFVAAETGRAVGKPPSGKGRISVVTLTELQAGVLAARNKMVKAGREETLERARAFIALAYDEGVSEALAKLLHAARLQRRRAPIQDSIVAATALAHGLSVWTLDDDFEVLAELEPKLRIHRT